MEGHRDQGRREQRSVPDDELRPEIGGPVTRPRPAGQVHDRSGLSRSELWHQYAAVDVPAGETVVHRFPDGFAAHWVRLKADCRDRNRVVHVRVGLSSQTGCPAPARLRSRYCSSQIEAFVPTVELGVVRLGGREGPLPERHFHFARATGRGPARARGRSVPPAPGAGAERTTRRSRCRQGRGRRFRRRHVAQSPISRPPPRQSPLRDGIPHQHRRSSTMNMVPVLLYMRRQRCRAELFSLMRAPECHFALFRFPPSRGFANGPPIVIYRPGGGEFPSVHASPIVIYRPGGGFPSVHAYARVDWIARHADALQWADYSAVLGRTSVAYQRPQ